MKNSNRLRWLRLALLALIAAPAPAQFPNTSALILAVEDQNGAAVKDAKVLVVNTATGAARDVVSGSDGLATLPALALTGTYTVSVSKQGFSNQELKGITLRSGETATLKVRLLVGSTSAEVAIFGTVDGVRADPQIGRRLDTSQIVETPILGRKSTTLSLLNSAFRQGKGPGDLFVNAPPGQLGFPTCLTGACLPLSFDPKTLLPSQLPARDITIRAGLRDFYVTQFAKYGLDFSKLPNYPDELVNPRSQVISIGAEHEVLRGFLALTLLTLFASALTAQTPMASTKPPKSTRVDISKDKPGGESSKFLSVVGNWSVVEDGGKKVYAVDGREWLRGNPSRSLAENARAIYGSKHEDFIDNVKAFAYFPYSVAKDIPDFQNGEISVKFKLVSGKLDKCAGILFNLKQTGDYLAVRFNGKEDNLVLWTFNKGVRKFVKKGTENVPLELNTWHTIKIAVHGTALEGWLDDKKQLDYTLVEPVTGKVGL